MSWCGECRHQAFDRAAAGEFPFLAVGSDKGVGFLGRTIVYGDRCTASGCIPCQIGAHSTEADDAEMLHRYTMRVL